MLDNGILVAVVGVYSFSRLDSLAVLQLRLCDHWLLEMPMEHSFFHFIHRGRTPRFGFDEILVEGRRRSTFGALMILSLAASIL